jgi:hypothetical protein
MVTEHHLSYLN